MIYTGLVKRFAQRRCPLLSVAAGCLVLAAFSGAADAQKRKIAPEAKQQWEFGVDMAGRGLWSEALFRFEQARRIEPDHPMILSNIAVSYEALGLFEEALSHYRQALRLAPRERDVRRNYSRFVEYYQNFRGDSGDSEAEDDPDAAELPESTAGAGGGGPGGPQADGR